VGFLGQKGCNSIFSIEGVTVENFEVMLQWRPKLRNNHEKSKRQEAIQIRSESIEIPAQTENHRGIQKIPAKAITSRSTARRISIAKLAKSS
jgi:hypothetical protein